MSDFPDPLMVQVIEDRAELVERIEMLEEENGRLRARLNDARYLAQRALALLSGGRLLFIAFAAGAVVAVVLYVGTPLGGILESAWHELTGTGQPVPHSVISPLPPFVAAEPTISPSPSTPPLSSPSPASSPLPVAVIKPLPATVPVPSPSLPVKVKHCPPLPGVPPRCLPLPSLPPI